MEKKRVDRSLAIKIPAMHTYLINQFVEICEKIKVQLQSGSAEIHGLELKKNYPHYYWVPCAIPVFSWEGAQIMIKWSEEEKTKQSDAYWGDITPRENQTPMVKYLSIFYQLTTLRKLALQEERQGPRLAIIGEKTSGIQNVSKLLLNNSGKFNTNPLFVDLDPESSIFVNDTIGALSFEYKICEDLFDRPNKLSFYYGNRKVYNKSYIEQIKWLKDIIRKKFIKGLKVYKEKGSEEEFPEFCSGMIIQCPKFDQQLNKEEQIRVYSEILQIYDVTHLIIINNSELDQYFSKPMFGKLQKYRTGVLQGTQNFLQLPRPLKSKIERYFDKESKKKTYPIKDIRIHEIMETSYQKPYLRLINVEEETVSKNIIAILHGEYDANLTSEELAMRALKSPICCLTYIFDIHSGQGQVILEVCQENLLQDFRDKLWITSVSEQ